MRSASLRRSLSGAIRRLGPSTVAREALIASLGVLPAATALRDRDLAAYHGVEHKAIGAYERGSFDPADAPKEHERCGSNLIAPAARPLGGRPAVGGAARPAVRGQPPRGLAGLASVSAAVELFAYAERAPDSAIGPRRSTPPGTRSSEFSPLRATEDQLEVGSAALQEILRAEAGDTVGFQARPEPADTL